VERVALSLSLYAVEFLAPTALTLAFLRSEIRRRYRDGVRPTAAFGPDGIPVPPRSGTQPLPRAERLPQRCGRGFLLPLVQF
jgi:hypothetical protein